MTHGRLPTNEEDSGEKRIQAALLAIVLFALALVVYLPVRHCMFIWDDQDYVTNNMTLRDLTGLKRIWLEPGAVPQYYPLVHTMFWVEYHLWELNPLGYHLINVLFHGLSAALVFLILSGLGMRGAWLAAAIFAVHPVHVESVAWITERKNVLSLYFYLTAALAWLRFSGLHRWTWEPDDGDRTPDGRREKNDGAQPGSGDVATEENVHAIASGAPWKLYGLCVMFYLFALLSKTVTCSLPAALLLVAYWKRGRLTRRDVLSTLPLFVMGLGFGILTAWMERTRVGAVGRFWDYTFVERCLIAGRVVWFYAGKLVFPYPLAFVYHRWTIDQTMAWLYVFPAGAVMLVAALWALRNRIGRGPLVAVLFFGGTLFPALGFLNVFPMRYSFVADHFQYHASLGLIALGAAGVAMGARRMAGRAAAGKATAAAGAAVLIVLAALTWRQLPVYRDYVTLFHDALAKTPDSSLALTSVAAISYETGNRPEAIRLYNRALDVDELDDVAHFNLGKILLEQQEAEKALEHLKRSVELSPECSHCHYFHGLALAILGRLDEAVPHYEKSIALDPGEPYQRYNYGVTLMQLEKLKEAEEQIREGLRLKPQMSEARYTLVDMLMLQDRVDEAEKVLGEGLALAPGDQQLRDMMAALREYRRTRKGH